MIDLKEIFLPLSGIDGCEVLNEKYRVSNYGKVYDIINYRFVKLSLCGLPQYNYITLTHGGVRGTYRVHRLQAMSFIPNPLNLPIVDHIDRDRLNNYVGNFRWVTKSQNCLNSDYVDRGIEKKRIKLIEKDANKLQVKRDAFIHKGVADRIQYLYKHEHISKIALGQRYKISSKKANIILEGIEPKERKPKFNFFDADRYYYRRYSREKYRDGIKPTIIGKLLGIPKSRVDKYIKGLPTLHRKIYSDEFKKQIYDYYILNKCSMTRAGKEFGVPKYIAYNAIKKMSDS